VINTPEAGIWQMKPSFGNSVDIDEVNVFAPNASQSAAITKLAPFRQSSKVTIDYSAQA